MFQRLLSDRPIANAHVATMRDYSTHDHTTKIISLTFINSNNQHATSLVCTYIYLHIKHLKIRDLYRHNFIPSTNRSNCLVWRRFNAAKFKITYSNIVKYRWKNICTAKNLIQQAKAFIICICWSSNNTEGNIKSHWFRFNLWYTLLSSLPI